MKTRGDCGDEEIPSRSFWWVLSGVTVFGWIVVIVVVALTMCGCDAIDEHNKEAMDYRKEYKVDFKKRLKEAIENTNPELPVAKRCRVVAEIMVPPGRWRCEWPCEQERFDIQTVCEVSLGTPEQW